MHLPISRWNEMKWKHDKSSTCSAWQVSPERHGKRRCSSSCGCPNNRPVLSQSQTKTMQQDVKILWHGETRGIRNWKVQRSLHLYWCRRQERQRQGQREGQKVAWQNHLNLSFVSFCIDLRMWDVKPCWNTFLSKPGSSRCADAFRCFLQFRSFEPEGPPDEIEEIGEALHTCEDQLVRNLEGFPRFPASPYHHFISFPCFLFPCWSMLHLQSMLRWRPRDPSCLGLQVYQWTSTPVQCATLLG